MNATTTAAKKKPKAAAKPAAPVKAAKAPVKAPVKTAPKAAQAKAPAKAAAKPAAKKIDAPKPAKIKLVRDSFTMPSDEYAALPALKQRALGFAHPAKKSELLRAGIKLLTGLSDAALLKALKNVPEIKTGRPKTK